MVKWLLCFLSILILLTDGFAQKDEKWAIGPHLVISFPQSDFANLSKTGEGLGGKLLYRFPKKPFFSPRFDFVYLSYGEKRKSETYSSGYFLVTTRNESFQMTVGPQFSHRIGRFTPYVAPMGGLYVYRTIVSIPDLYYYYGYPSAETTSSLTRWGWTINGGILIDIGLGPHIDIGVKYQKIADAVESLVQGERVKSDAEDINISIGVLFYLSDE